MSGLCDVVSVGCMVAQFNMSSCCTSVGDYLCDSLDFLWVRLHAFFAEYGATEWNLWTFYLNFLLLNP